MERYKVISLVFGFLILAILAAGVKDLLNDKDEGATFATTTLATMPADDGYGITPDGQVFVSINRLAPNDSVFCTILFDDGTEETVNMNKYGNYYFGKPNRNSKNITLWFFQRHRETPWTEMQRNDIANQTIIELRLE